MRYDIYIYMSLGAKGLSKGVSILRYTYIARLINTFFVFTISHLPPLGIGTFFRASELAVPLQPLPHGVLQCLVIRVIISSQTLFQRNKETII